MKKHTSTLLEVTLTRVIEDWWDKTQGDMMMDWDDMPLVGEEVFEIMATAAVSVLRGAHDTQQYMERERGAASS